MRDYPHDPADYWNVYDEAVAKESPIVPVSDWVWVVVYVLALLIILAVSS